MAYSLFQHLLVLLSLVAVCGVIKADEGLMERECHYAKDPTICMQCLRSVPSSQQSEAVGVARVILRCLTSHVNTLARSVSTLASSHHEMPVVTALTQCDWAYRTTKRLVGRGDEYVKRGEYKEGKFILSRIASLPRVCEKNLEALKLLLPPDVHTETLLFSALIDAELNIIDHL